MYKCKFTIHAKFNPLLLASAIVFLSLTFGFSTLENELQISEIITERTPLLSLVDVTDTVDTEVFYIVEEMPKFQGKEFGAFKEWIANNLEYPTIAEKDSITGKVYVQFIINSKGNVVDIIVTRGVHPLLDTEAIRVIESSPVWAPGKQRGKKVCVQFTFPVNFVLD